MKKVLFITLLISFLFQGVYAGQNLKTGKKVKLKGTVINTSEKTISLIRLSDNQTIAKSDIDKKGKFSMEFELEKEDLFALVLNRQNYVLLDIMPGETINFTYDVSNFDNIKVSGSPNTKLYIDLIKILRNTSRYNQDKVIDSIVNANNDKLLMVLFAQSLDMQDYSSTHKKLISNLEKKFSDNGFFQDYKQEFEATQKIKIGATAPDIALPDTNGNIVKLSSLRGQYVLLDFWASWCHPCRGESPNLVKAYEKYHDKGFTIYSVSLDRYKSNWLQAIHADGLQKWTHVSDLKFWNSEGAKIYSVRAIPSNFLIDKNGKIIAKNLRGSKLDEELSKIFDK